MRAFSLSHSPVLGRARIGRRGRGEGQLKSGQAMEGGRWSSVGSGGALERVEWRSRATRVVGLKSSEGKEGKKRRERTTSTPRIRDELEVQRTDTESTLSVSAVHSACKVTESERKADLCCEKSDEEAKKHQLPPVSSLPCLPAQPPLHTNPLSPRNDVFLPRSALLRPMSGAFRVDGGRVWSVGRGVGEERELEKQGERWS